LEANAAQSLRYESKSAMSMNLTSSIRSESVTNINNSLTQASSLMPLESGGSVTTMSIFMSFMGNYIQTL
jgi:hypothetical protein